MASVPVMAASQAALRIAFKVRIGVSPVGAFGWKVF
jgi:hypothetical protein